MPEPDPAAAPAAAPVAHTVTIAGEARTIERMSGLKLARALAIVRAAGAAVPKIVNRVGEFRTEYEASHMIELDRAQALMRYGPRVIFNGDGDPVLDDAGQARMAPGALAHMTDTDWQASGNKLRIPSSPSTAEVVAALLPEVLEYAEDPVYDLLTLFLTSNSELKRIWRDGSHVDVLKAARDDLLADSYADELLELAVVCGELVDSQFTRKASELGDRLGKALRLVGMDPAALTPPPDQAQQETPEEENLETTATSSSAPSSSPATSSIASPSPTDGPGTSPSTPPPTSSSSSDTDSSETASSSSEPSSTPSASTPPPVAA